MFSSHKFHTINNEVSRIFQQVKVYSRGESVQIYQMSLLQCNDLSSILVGVCHCVQRLISLYNENRDPNELDFLVYQVNRLYHILTACDWCNSQLLEDIAIGLRLMEEQSASEDLPTSYSPQSLCSGGRGRPRLVI